MSKQFSSRNKSERSKKGQQKKSKSKKSISIPINYEHPQIPVSNDHHAEVKSEVDTVDIFNDSHPENEEEKYDHKNKNGKLWDEVEMKGHGFVDKKGYHKLQTEEENKVEPDRRVPADELAMKQCGLIDNHCHHMTEEEIHPHEQADDGPHVNFISLVEAPSLRESASSISDAATSNAELVVTLRESITQGQNILSDLKFKHEYIEYRIGDKGRAMAIWNDGTEDMYEFTGDSVYQITRNQN